MFNDDWMRERGFLEEDIKTAADLIKNHNNEPLVTVQTEELVFIDNNKREKFTNISDDNFEYQKRIQKALNYQISSSNKNLQDYENLQFSVDVVKDEFPLISVSSNIDSISRGVSQFAGQISDDYGLQKLQLVYYNEDTPNKKNNLTFKLLNKTFKHFSINFLMD